MEVKGVGKVHPYTLREISEIGVVEFNKKLALLFVDSSVLDDKVKEEIDITKVKGFDIIENSCVYDSEMKKMYEEALSFFLKEEVEFYSKYSFFVVGDIKEERVLHRENFDEFLSIIKQQNNISKEVKKAEKKMSEKQKRLMEKREKGRKLMAKAKGQDDIGLFELATNLSIFLGEIEKVFNLTLYQFYNQLEKYMRKDTYERNFNMYLQGADPKKLNLDVHWTAKDTTPKEGVLPPPPNAKQ